MQTIESKCPTHQVSMVHRFSTGNTQNFEGLVLTISWNEERNLTRMQIGIRVRDGCEWRAITFHTHMHKSSTSLFQIGRITSNQTVDIV